MPIELRPATPADADAIAELWYAGWRDGHVDNVPAELAAVRTRESFQPRAANRIPHTTVAVDAGEVIGFTVVIGDEVEQVYVSASHRGSGTAATLLSDAEQQVAAGHGSAWLAVAPGNTRARRFYERQGWADEGGFEYQAEVDGGTIAVPCRRYVKRVSRAQA